MNTAAMTVEAWEFAPVDYISAQCGGPRWVVARRTPRIVAKYGEDVITLSHKVYLAIGAKWRAEPAKEKAKWQS